MNCAAEHPLEIPDEFRPIPFWSWNDRLDPAELIRQIHAMKEARIGGFFMHARSGLKTPYMGEEYLHCVAVCIREASQLSMEPWLYDEIGWPSGFGAGSVNAMGEAYQQKFLQYRMVDCDECASERIVGFYSKDGCHYLGGNATNLPGGTVLEITYKINPFYVDLLNPDVTEKFIEVTHQRYYDALEPELRNKLKGIFTDEPQVVIGKPVYSPFLFDTFTRRYDSDIKTELPKLWLDLPGSARFRIRFYGLIAELFSQNYTGKIGAWCREHGWEFTGHQVQELNYSEAINSNGSVMPHYRYYTVPGVDWLGYVEPSIFVFTQLASMAAQFGKKRTLVETFALCGWNLNFRGMKHLYTEMQLLGVNFLCPHLQSYSLRGMRKRDYPPSLFSHQPWWGDYRELNDMFSRVNCLLAEGKNPVDTLILHGQSSAWALYRNESEQEEVDRLTRSIESLSELLFSKHIPFHYAEEGALGECGECLPDGTLKLGICRYRYLVIPECVNISSAVWRILQSFSGKVYRCKSIHNIMVDGEEATPELKAYFDSLPELPEPLPMSPILYAAGDIRATRRIYEDCIIYYLTGNGKVKVKLPEAVAALEKIDPETGGLTRLELTDGNTFHWDFPPNGALLLRALKHSSTTPKWKAWKQTISEKLPDRAGLRLQNDNFLVLDRVSYRVDDGEFVYDDVSVIQWRLLALKRSCDLTMRFSFEIGDSFDLSMPLSVVMENPECYQGEINNIEFQLKDAGEVFDPAFRRVPLPVGTVRRGSNTLELSTRFEQDERIYDKIERARQFETEFNRLVFDLEIESIFLAGAFGVFASERFLPLPRQALRQYGTFRLEALPETIDPADLTGSGLPFFAGKLVLDFKCSPAVSAEPMALRTNLMGANSVRFQVNGEDCGIRFWEPYESNSFHPREDGENLVSLELTTSLRNLLGPFHLAEGESCNVGILSFSKEPNNVVPWELPPYDSGYCVISIGIRESVFIKCQP